MDAPPSLILRLVLLCICTTAWADGENAFDRMLGSMSKGAHYLSGRSCESADPRQAGEDLNRASAAVCAKLSQSAPLTRQTADLRAVARAVEEKAEDKFFALLSLEHASEMKCAAAAADLISSDPARLKKIAEKIIMVRDAKLKLAGLASELSSKGIVGCTKEDERPNPNWPGDPRAAGCRELLAARTAFQALSESIPLMGTPSLQKYLNRAQVDRSLSEEGVVAALKNAYAGAHGELAAESAKLTRLGENGGAKIDRPTRRALMSDPARVQALLDAGGNSVTIRALACDADARYGTGAATFEKGVMIGSIMLTPVLGAGSVAVRGGALLRTAAGARAAGSLSLAGTRLLQLGVIGSGGALSYESLNRACWSKDQPTMRAQCRDDFSVAQMEKEDCRLAGVLTAAGAAALLASSPAIRGFLRRPPPAPMAKGGIDWNVPAAPLSNAERRAQQMIEGVNPTCGQTNCVSTAITAELRFQGRQVSAVPDSVTPNGAQVTQKSLAQQGIKTYGQQNGLSVSDLHRAVGEMTEGQRAIIVSNEAGAAHAFNAVHLEGKSVFVDAQNGRVFTDVMSQTQDPRTTFTIIYTSHGKAPW